MSPAVIFGRVFGNHSNSSDGARNIGEPPLPQQDGSTLFRASINFLRLAEANNCSEPSGTRVSPYPVRSWRLTQSEVENEFGLVPVMSSGRSESFSYSNMHHHRKSITSTGDGSAVLYYNCVIRRRRIGFRAQLVP